MDITYLGHAGFYVESESSVIIIDPWLSTSGAFDSAWFQYPKNSHMADYLLQRFETTTKDKYIYISHGHKNHFDIEFLKSIKKRNFKFILANFKRSVIKEQLLELKYSCEGILSLNYADECPLKDGYIKLFMLDAGLDSDSAVLVKAGNQTFLNLNDCRLYEKLKKIIALSGPIDVFSAQFSGALWHPVCYELPEEEYQKISLRKKLNKFAVVTQAIETVNPKVYLPAAGRPCFLDPALMHINFEKNNIFAHTSEYISYLDEHCKASNTQWLEIMPGDILDVGSAQFTHLAQPRVVASDFESYVKEYAKEYSEYFQKRQEENKKIDSKKVFMDLQTDLEEKLRQLKLIYVRAHFILYWKITDYPHLMYRIDLNRKNITTTDEITDTDNFVLISAPAWQVNKVLTGEMNWPDFALTFRVKLLRKPERYDAVTHGFIAVDTPEIARFSRLTEQFEANNKEQITVECAGKKYSITRWCPHMGGDLSAGWEEDGAWVCPRHQMHFDLKNGGKCLTSTKKIDVICSDKNSK